ncbi:MAG: hypothetical protein WC082_05885 [Victivallales bacterium]
MLYLYMLLVMLILFWLQLLLGCLALHVPLCIAGIFYISVAYSWRYGIFWAVLAGFSLDLVYDREFLMTTVSFLPAVLFAEYRLRRDAVRLRNCVPAGAVIALLGIIPVWAYKIITYPAYTVTIFQNLLPATIFAVCLNALFLPFLVMVLDETGEKIKLPQFTKAGKRLIEERLQYN